MFVYIYVGVCIAECWEKKIEATRVGTGNPAENK